MLRQLNLQRVKEYTYFFIGTLGPVMSVVEEHQLEMKRSQSTEQIRSQHI